MRVMRRLSKIGTNFVTLSMIRGTYTKTKALFQILIISLYQLFS